MATDASTATPGWDELYQRLETARLALERGFTPSPDAQRRILRDRAQVLAQVPTSEETASPAAFDIVEFRLADETYGLAAAYVREVYPLRTYTPLPCTPPFVLGIVNIHGQILSILDSRTLFDLPSRRLTELSHVMVVHNDHMEFALLADAILGFRAISVRDIHPARPTLTTVGAKYVQGISADQIVILDAPKLLSDEALIIREEVEL